MSVKKSFKKSVQKCLISFASVSTVSLRLPSIMVVNDKSISNTKILPSIRSIFFAYGLAINPRLSRSVDEAAKSHGK